MKAVILLVCLVLVQIAGGEDGAEVLNNDVREDHERHIREEKEDTKKQKKKNRAAKLKRKMKGKKKAKNSKLRGKGIANEKKKPKKSTPRKTNKINGNKNGNRPGKVKGNQKGNKHLKKLTATKNRRYKQKKTNKNDNKLETAAESRQSDECFTTLCEQNKNFNVYRTQLRKASRVKSWVEHMDKKKAKAATTFNNASDAIKASTLNGTICGGGAINDEAKEANEKLQKCKTTASEKCSSSKIDGLNISLITMCKPKLQAYIDSYMVCLKTCDCSCFTGLALVDLSCIKFTDLETKTKEAKNKCNKPVEEGSFGDCRKQEILVAHYGNKCKACSTSTKASDARKQFLVQRYAGRK